MEDLQKTLPKDAVVKIQSDDYDRFSHFCSNYVKNAVVIYDDAGSFFGSGAMTKAQKQLLKTPKNNGLELLLQFHYFGGTEVSPDLLKMMNMLVLKRPVMISMTCQIRYNHAKKLAICYLI
jgi:hypothetical protein